MNDQKNNLKMLIGNGIMLGQKDLLTLAETLAKTLLLEFPDNTFLQTIIKDKEKTNLWPYIEKNDILRNIKAYQGETRYKVVEKTDKGIHTIHEGSGNYLKGFKKSKTFFFGKSEITKPHFDRLNFHF